MSIAFDALPETLKSVRTRPLFVLRLAVNPMQLIGATPGGFRRVAAVTGGTFEGDRLSGVVLEGGSDWQFVRSDAITLDVRLVLKTQDGSLITMTYKGFRHGLPAVIARIDKGEQVDPSEYYFRTSPTFDTAAPAFDWLNRIVAIGVGQRRADGPVYSIFEVL
jgi:hypothetical protein